MVTALLAQASADEGITDRILAGGIAVVGLVLGGLAWSGRWRSWVNLDEGIVLITVAPPMCVLMLVYAIDVPVPVGLDVPTFLLILVGAPVSWYLFLARPRWFGPRWYREMRAEAATAYRGRVGGAAVASRNSEQMARAARAPLKPAARRRVLFVDPALGRPLGTAVAGAAPGHLLFYPEELVFVAESGDDAVRPGPTIRRVPAEAIVAVREGEGGGLRGGKVRQAQVHVDVVDGEGWTFEPVRRGATMADLRRTYLGGTGPGR